MQVFTYVCSITQNFVTKLVHFGREFVLLGSGIVPLFAFLRRSIAVDYTVCVLLLPCNTIHLISVPFDIIEGINNNNIITDETFLNFEFNPSSNNLLICWIFCYCILLPKWKWEYLCMIHFCLLEWIIRLLLTLFAYGFAQCMKRFLLPLLFYLSQESRTWQSTAFSFLWYLYYKFLYFSEIIYIKESQHT